MFFKKASSAFTKFKQSTAKSVQRGDYTFRVDVSSDGKVVIFSTAIYQAEGAIPRKIKEQALRDLHFDKGTVDTRICFDDDKGVVIMYYSKKISELDYSRFNEIVDQLEWIADQRKEQLDLEDPFDYEFVCVIKNFAS